MNDCINIIIVIVVHVVVVVVVVWMQCILYTLYIHSIFYARFRRKMCVLCVRGSCGGYRYEVHAGLVGVMYRYDGNTSSLPIDGTSGYWIQVRTKLP